MKANCSYTCIVDLTVFGNESPGTLRSISGSDRRGEWTHAAFVPRPLGDDGPELTPATYRAVAEARASLAALDSTAHLLPDATLFRQPAWRREAQSTSALEGTYAPLVAVLEADEDSPGSADLTEILNYVRMAEHGSAWIAEGRPITTGLLDELQGILMRGTPLDDTSGRVRDIQVVIGVRDGVTLGMSAIETARFVPTPPGPELEIGVEQLAAWIDAEHPAIDPVVATALAHYQFEALHPYRDGNGRLGRLLIVLHLVKQGVLVEPTLTVSPWFEARRRDYYDHLLAVSAAGAWDDYVRFFATGLAASADDTRNQMLALRAVQEDLRERVRRSKLRADTAIGLVDLAVARPSFTVRQAAQTLGVSYPRANELVTQLMAIDVLDVVDDRAYKRRFYAPDVMDVLTRGGRE